MKKIIIEYCLIDNDNQKTTTYKYCICLPKETHLSEELCNEIKAKVEEYAKDKIAGFTKQMEKLKLKIKKVFENGVAKEVCVVKKLLYKYTKGTHPTPWTKIYDYAHEEKHEKLNFDVTSKQIAAEMKGGDDTVKVVPPVAPVQPVVIQPVAPAAAAAVAAVAPTEPAAAAITESESKGIVESIKEPIVNFGEMVGKIIGQAQEKITSALGTKTTDPQMLVQDLKGGAINEDDEYYRQKYLKYKNKYHSAKNAL